MWKCRGGGIGIDTTAPVDQQVAAASSFYNEFVGMANNGLLFGGSYATFLFWIITFGVNIYLVYRGLSGGIEKFVRYAMPVMALAALIVLIRVLTLGTPDPARPEQNVLNGLGYMWNPDFTALAVPQTWLAAAGQIFFSLSIGFGIIINYASYLSRKDEVVLSGLTAVSTNELFEVGFGGLITLTASFVFLGLTGTVAAVATGSFGLGFNTLPVVFAHMGALGNFIGAVWFLMLFLAAMTSSLSMYQPSLAFFRESLGISRKAGTAVVVAICGAGSFLTIWFSKDGTFWATLDGWVGTFFVFILAMGQIVMFSWIFGIKRAMKEAHQGAEINIPRFYRPVIRWLSPIYLLLIFIAFCVTNLGDWIRAVAQQPTAQLALALVGVVTVMLLVMVRIGEKRWRAAGLDLDDRNPATYGD